MSWLTGKTALVTGAAKRIGREIALAFASEGAAVVVHYHTSTREAEETAEAVRRAGVRAWLLQADLSRPAEAADAFAAAHALSGGVQVLVNSASIFPEGTILTAGLEEFSANLDTNAFSPLVLSRELAARTPETGAIVNLLDARIVDNDRMHAPYNVSKRVLFTLTRMLAVELAPAVRVNAVAPGLILPPPGGDDSYLKRLAHTNPLRTHGGVRDIAEAAVYLANARFVTGQILYVDGGRHMKGNMYGH